MINDDILVKFSIEALSKGKTRVANNWVDYTRALQKQIQWILGGFPGIGKGDVSIVPGTSVKVSQRIFLDDNLDTAPGISADTAAILGRVLEITDQTIATIEIDGIGQGTDFSRDPSRQLTWRTKIQVDLSKYPTVLRLDSKPRSDGGPVYYYFMKYWRDSRW